MIEITTTLRRMERHNPSGATLRVMNSCLHHPGAAGYMDEPISLVDIFEKGGVEATVACLRSVSEGHDNAVRMLGIRCVRIVTNIVKNRKLVHALTAMENYIHGKCSWDSFDAARKDAWGPDSEAFAGNGTPTWCEDEESNCAAHAISNVLLYHLPRSGIANVMYYLQFYPQFDSAIEAEFEKTFSR